MTNLINNDIQNAARTVLNSAPSLYRWRMRRGITFMPVGRPLPEQDNNYRTLTDDQLADILKQLPTKPSMAGEDDVSLSLAGAQDKLAIRVNKTPPLISLPPGNAPSTHILKPAIERFESIVFNELFCIRLASQIGIPTHGTCRSPAPAR